MHVIGSASQLARWYTRIGWKHCRSVKFTYLYILTPLFAVALYLSGCAHAAQQVVPLTPKRAATQVAATCAVGCVAEAAQAAIAAIFTATPDTAVKLKDDHDPGVLRSAAQWVVDHLTRRSRARRGFGEDPTERARAVAEAILKTEEER